MAVDGATLMSTSDIMIRTEGPAAEEIRTFKGSPGHTAICQPFRSRLHVGTKTLKAEGRRAIIQSTSTVLRTESRVLPRSSPVNLVDSHYRHCSR